MILLNNIYSTPLYSLKTPCKIVNYKDAFYIQYLSFFSTVLELSFKDGTVKEFNLPVSNSILRYQIPVSVGSEISSFRVRSNNPEKDNGSFQIHQAGVEPLNTGFSLVSNNGFMIPVIRKGFNIKNSNTYSFASLSMDSKNGFNQVQVSLSYDYSGDGETGSEIEIFSDNHRKSFGLFPRKGGTELYFYSKSLDFIPTGLSVKNIGPNFKVREIAITPFSTMVSPDYSPIPADIGTILNYKQAAWRRSDMEIFSWNLFPDILILDFKDYSLQSAFLKRITFFLEKDGFKGQLLNNKVLSGLHGWNAHDYRAKDLAEFFTVTEKQNFTLNPEEYELRDILINNKIIHKYENGYLPDSGGILSFTMESSPRLRHLFITHEGYHGIYFSDTRYEPEVQKVWNSLDEAEKQFWYNFLDWKHYEIEDAYLVVNEFQAYLMQQKVENVESYYKDYIIPRYLVEFPERAEEMNNFLINYPNHFVDNAKKVEAAVFRLDTIRAGELRCLY